MKKVKIKLFGLLIVIAILLSQNMPAYAYSYNVVFSNVPPSILNWNCPTSTWWSVNSKWNQPRPVTGGTNPHRGIDILAPFGTELKAVWSGWTTHVGTYTIQQRLDINNDGINNDTYYYTYYYHLSNREPEGYYNKGVKIGNTGNEGGLWGDHLHFGGLDSGTTWCRNEVCYRWTSNWNGGKDVDSFSNVQWNNPSCQITAYFKDENGVYAPGEVKIFHRQHGISTWTDGGLMTNAGNYNYTYNFSGKYPSGTQIDWLVRIKRSGLSVYSYCWAPAKFDQPDPNPNATSYAYAYYLNTLY